MNRQDRGEDLDRNVKEAIGHLEARMLEGKGEDFLKSLEWWSRFRDYSWGNATLILMQKPHAIQCAGFRLWEKLGFTVRKGERAIWIKAPQMKKLPDPDTGEIAERLIGWLAVPVFDIAQCNEWPDKQPPSPFQPETTADWQLLYDCFSRRLATLYQIPVVEQDMGGLTFGMTNGKVIRLNSRQEVSIKTMTMIHEAAHIAAGHPTKEGHARWSLKERETHVEAASFVLCRMLGADHPNAANYLLHYKVEPGTLVDHIETITSIVREVRNMLNFKELAKEVSLAEAEAA